MTAPLSRWHEPYAFLPNGRTVRRWTFGCESAVTVEMLDLGATLHTLRAPDRDGQPDVTVDYLLDGSGELTIDYRATADAATVVNLTNHAYFNLAGEGSGETVLDRLLQVDADAYSPVDPDLLSLGSPAPVEGTPFDLTDPCAIGEAIAADHAQLKLAGSA